MIYSSKIIGWKRFDYGLQLAVGLLFFINLFTRSDAQFSIGLVCFISLAVVQIVSAVLHWVHQSKLCLSKKRKQYELNASACVVSFAFLFIFGFTVDKEGWDFGLMAFICYFAILAWSAILAISYFYICIREVTAMLEANAKAKNENMVETSTVDGDS
jgi:protein-S-isoprenylcysteine O-methyltransferase Ste14